MWEHGLLDVPLICHFSCWFFKLSLIVIILMERTVSCSVLWFSLVDLSFTGFIVSWFQKRNSQAPKRIKFYIQSWLNFIKSYTLFYVKLFEVINTDLLSKSIGMMMDFAWKTSPPATNVRRLLIGFQIFRPWTLVLQQTIPAETVSADKCCSCVLLLSTIPPGNTLKYPKT